MMNQMKYTLGLLIDVDVLACKPTITLIDNFINCLLLEVCLSQMFKPVEGWL